MIALHRLTFVLLGSLLLAHAHGQSSPSNRPWPAPVQKVPDQSPALSPADALQTFHLPPGYRLELVASEPLVRDPISIEWDTKGRLWVVEMQAYLRNRELPEPNLDPMCTIAVLEDTNGDGKMDKRTVFADGLVLPRSLKVLERGVLVAEPPNIWFMQDRDGDLKMDSKELVSDKFGRRNGSVEGNANSLFWAMDNCIYTAESDIYLRFKNGKFEVRRTLARGEWGVTHDDAGRVFRNTNESALHVDFVPTQYYARNPNLLRTRGSYDVLGRFDEVNTVWPVRPNPGTNRAYQEGVDRPDGTLARFTSVCAPLVYRGDRLPAELYGSVFLAEPAANLVGRVVMADDGRGLRVRKAYEKGEFIASTDERFRPVYISNAPDGTLTIVDMYRGIIQQRISITQYLHGEILKRKLDQTIEHGRIYRVMHTTTRRDETPALDGYSADQLVAALSHPNGWRRDRAQQILVERGDKSVAPALLKLATTATDARARQHALWTLDGIDAIDAFTVIKALSDASRDVRVAAIRIAERWLGEPASPVPPEVLKRLDDADWWVREQLAASLGALPVGPRENAIASVLERYADDPVVMDAAISSVRGTEVAVLDRLLKTATTKNARVESAITMLAATVLRASQDGPAQNDFAWVADEARPAWQRDALLRGAEVALLGATMPGTVARERPTLGARGGPAGEFKFGRSEGTESSSGRRGGSGGTRLLRVNREPAAFSAFAARGEWSERAKKVIARVEWPGKPGATVITPLTAEQQRRYDAGKETYQNLCQACHQPDGRGQENVASLVGSELAQAAPEIAMRILLNGKEGTLGLMPPLGAALSDDQIAAVLTYIRREWGQTGSAVEPGAVKPVRSSVAGRPRPWTNDELLKLPEAAGMGNSRRPNR
ncbi:MAG TPA: c-type cytochrome [Opitutaceae bacterium]|nr:c-type cytochrome [Opitutaceae bacterium]